MDENLIITYSPKYKAYQRKIRSRQIERAKKIIETPDGEIAEKKVYDIDLEQIKKEEMYDGFYAVITNLESDIREIININKQRWEIEENFRIMKTDFEARPVYVRREDRIKAHFISCISVVYPLLYPFSFKRFVNSSTVTFASPTQRTASTFSA
nr:transposase [Anaerostipes sp. MSJ-23]